MSKDLIILLLISPLNWIFNQWVVRKMAEKCEWLDRISRGAHIVHYQCVLRISCDPQRWRTKGNALRMDPYRIS